MTKHHHPTEPSDLSNATRAWDGTPTTLAVSDSANLPQTPTGTVLLAWYNLSKQNNPGELTVTSGGGWLRQYPAPALAYQPSVLMNNWEGNNISVSNTSNPGSDIPIWIAAYGPGLSSNPLPLPSNGSPVVLNTLLTAQGRASSTNMQLTMINNNGTLAVVAIIGGPRGRDGNNGYLIALNASADTGPSPLPAPPPGYYATTTANSYAFRFNWGASTIFVASMSPDTTLSVVVTLRSL